VALRQIPVDNCEYESRDPENTYSRAKGIPVKQVKDTPSEKMAKELDEWRRDVRERLSRRLEEVDGQIANQVEKVDRVREWKLLAESAER